MIRELRVRGWLGLGLLAFLAFAFVFLDGMWAGGLEVDETCAAAGQTYDQDYRNRHREDIGQVFPMREECNADYDLVPFWVNPALVVTAVAVVGCAGGAAVTTVRLIRRHLR